MLRRVREGGEKEGGRRRGERRREGEGRRCLVGSPSREQVQIKEMEGLERKSVPLPLAYSCWLPNPKPTLCYHNLLRRRCCSKYKK
jgi:hypothetical protein